MGFMDKFKDAAAQAQQAAGGAQQQGGAAAGMGGMAGMDPNAMAAAAQGQDMGAQMAERDKIMRIDQVGVDGRATVVSMREVGADPLSGGKTIEFDLAVQGDAPYRVTMQQSMHPVSMTGIAEGVDVTVKIDPENPQSMLVFGAAQ